MIDSDFDDEPDCLASMDLEERIQHLMDGGCESCEDREPLCFCGHVLSSHNEENRPHRYDGATCLVGCRCQGYIRLPNGDAA